MKERQEKHLIIGAGEVGQALFNVLKKHYYVVLRDKDGHKKEKFDVVHIAYPPSKNFVRITRRYNVLYRPRLIIVHSTVPVGTTRKLGRLAVHSPIRGTHTRGHHPGVMRGKKQPTGEQSQSYLGQSLKFFVKYFAGPKAPEAAQYFEKAGIATRVFKKPETTELLKILDTTYLGWNVVFAKEVKRMCDEKGLYFDEVYAIPNRDYNEGYRRFGMPHVIRPVLKAMPGKIGGHCVIQNCDLLDDWLTQIVKERNKKY
ncbi:hypothetical protein HY504_01560 [Candidatus Wolfebacteria bacterium]|nr:hypothetical protein [Candidatus Wolfebacteria bacterium]